MLLASLHRGEVLLCCVTAGKDDAGASFERGRGALSLDDRKLDGPASGELGKRPWLAGRMWPNTGVLPSGVICSAAGDRQPVGVLYPSCWEIPITTGDRPDFFCDTIEQ